MEPASQQQFEYEVMRELQEEDEGRRRMDAEDIKQAMEEERQKNMIFYQMSCVLEKIGFNERFK